MFKWFLLDKDIYKILCKNTKSYAKIQWLLENLLFNNFYVNSRDSIKRQCENEKNVNDFVEYRFISFLPITLKCEAA